MRALRFAPVSFSLFSGNLVSSPLLRGFFPDAYPHTTATPVYGQCCLQLVLSHAKVAYPGLDSVFSIYLSCHGPSGQILYQR